MMVIIMIMMMAMMMGMWSRHTAKATRGFVAPAPNDRSPDRCFCVCSFFLFGRRRISLFHVLFWFVMFQVWPTNVGCRHAVILSHV